MIKMLKKIKSPAIKKHQGSSLIIFCTEKIYFCTFQFKTSITKLLSGSLVCTVIDFL